MTFVGRTDQEDTVTVQRHFGHTQYCLQGDHRHAKFLGQSSGVIFLNLQSFITMVVQNTSEGPMDWDSSDIEDSARMGKVERFLK